MRGVHSNESSFDAQTVRIFLCKPSAKGLKTGFALLIKKNSGLEKVSRKKRKIPGAFVKATTTNLLTVFCITLHLIRKNEWGWKEKAEENVCRRNSRTEYTKTSR